MIDWAVLKGWLQPFYEEKTVIYRFKETEKTRPDLREIVHTQRKISEPLMLGLFDEDYLVEEKKDNPKTLSGFRIPILPNKFKLLVLWTQLAKVEPKWYLANPQLEKELAEFREFLTKKLNLRLPTVEGYIENILRILGWLHRRKSIPLDQLSLTTLIPYRKLKFNLSEYTDESGRPNSQLLFEQRSWAQEMAKEDAAKTVKLVEDYCSNTCQSPASAVRQFTSAMSCAKFIYRNETEDFLLKGGFSDVPIIVQCFILIALMTALPPGRPREYRELELGRTLVKGELNAGRFIPAEKMKQPELAKYYFHLMPEDYKTGNTYGEWWGEIPNIIYSDGQSLYEYLEEWLTEWRPVFKPQHNFVFTQTNGRAITDDGFKGKVKHIFVRFTGVPVNPHGLRHMYVTHLRDIGVGEAELEAAAYAMRHSRKTQSEIYDLQDKQEKLAPILRLTKQISETHFRKLADRPQF